MALCKTIRWSVSVALFAAVCAPFTALAAGSVEAPLGLPANLSVNAGANGCENNPGPSITLSGKLSLGGLNGRLIFRNNTKGTHTHTEDVTTEVVILEPGQSVQFAKQPPLGGVGGNPFIYLQFLDGSMKALSDPILLGRCVQGLSPASLDFIHAVVGKANITAGSCTNSGGPFVTVSGALTLGGINGKLIFTNSDNYPPHVRDEDVQISFVILPPGESITFAKQPPLGGAGGNPLVYFQFTDPAGNPLSDEFSLGRCSQLGD